MGKFGRAEGNSAVRLLTNAISIVIILAAAVLVRAPYFSSLVIDWDEGTFAIMGQDILDGHLPYVHLWDVKPPLAYVPYAGFIAAFGRNVTAIRLGGLLCVALAAFVVSCAARKAFGRRAGLWAGLLLVIFSSTIPSGEATMTEHLVLVPLSLIVLLSWRPATPVTCFLQGGLIALCSLVRTNLVYGFFAEAAILLIAARSPSLRERFGRLAALGAGFVLPILLVILVYGTTGHLELLWRSAVLAPLAYTQVPAIAFAQRAGQFLYSVLRSIISINFLIWLAAGLGFKHVLTREADARRRQLAVHLAILSGVILLSIALTGRQYPHYYIQIVPFLAVLGSVHLAALEWRQPGFASALTVIGLLLPLAPVARQDVRLLAHHPDAEQASETAILHYFQSQPGPPHSIYFQTFHVGYWLLHADLPTKFVHPQNIYSAGLVRAVDGEHADTASELHAIFSRTPSYVVKETHERYDPANEIGGVLGRNYTLAAQFGSIQVFHRIAGDD